MADDLGSGTQLAADDLVGDTSLLGRGSGFGERLLILGHEPLSLVNASVLHLALQPSSSRRLLSGGGSAVC